MRARRVWHILAVTVIVIGFVNFFTFMVVSSTLGGTAIEVIPSNGHHYLSNHGNLTEVTAAQWGLVHYWTVSVFITHPLAMAGLWRLRWEKT